MPLITRTVPTPPGRTHLTVTGVETSLCDAWAVGAWHTHPDAVDPDAPLTWTIDVPATGPDEYLRIREQLTVGEDGTALESHRVTVPAGGPHQLDTLPTVER